MLGLPQRGQHETIKVGPGLKGLFKMDKLVNGKPVTEANVRELINDRRQRDAVLRRPVVGSGQERRHRVFEDAVRAPARRQRDVLLHVGFCKAPSRKVPIV